MAAPPLAGVACGRFWILPPEPPAPARASDAPPACRSRRAAALDQIEDQHFGRIVACKASARSSLTAAPSPALALAVSGRPRRAPLHPGVPSGSELVVTRSPFPAGPVDRGVLVDLHRSVPPSRDASRRSFPFRSSGEKFFCSKPREAAPLGDDPDLEEVHRSVREALNSLCATPVPALMRCTSPGRISPRRRSSRDAPARLGGRRSGFHVPVRMRAEPLPWLTVSSLITRSARNPCVRGRSGPRTRRCARNRANRRWCGNVRRPCAT